MADVVKIAKIVTLFGILTNQDLNPKNTFRARGDLAVLVGFPSPRGNRQNPNHIFADSRKIF